MGMGTKLPTLAFCRDRWRPMARRRLLGHQAGTAAGPDQARRGCSGAGGKAARRRRQDRWQDLVQRAAEPGAACDVELARVPGKLCGGGTGRLSGLHLRRARTDVRLIFITLLALMLATAIGLGATWMTATRGTDLGTLTIGAWTARPKTGTADVDPYSRASIARSGELPIGAGDGVAFSATTDDRKRPLDGRCDVVVSGVTPRRGSGP